MNFSAIVLSGGKSSRMKTDKSELLLGERTLLEIQVDKLLELGCDDVIISGKLLPSGNILNYSDVQKSEFSNKTAAIHRVSDLIPDLGPMGGLYSCFPECRHSCAVVISVDVPLLQTKTLRKLLNAHLANGSDATILSYEGHLQPLIGVYNTCHTKLCRELIDNKKLAIKSLLERIDCQYYDFHGDPNELLNCNSPEDYEQIKHVLALDDNMNI